MSFFGKEYTFDKQENFEAFVSSLGLPEDQANLILNQRPNQKITQNGDSYTMVTILPDSKKEVTFKSGVPFKEVVSGSNAETTITLNGNTVTQTQKFEDGTVFNFTKVYSDNDISVTITSNKFNGTARRFYKAV